MLSGITDRQIEILLGDTARRILACERERLKDFLQQLVERIEFDAHSGACSIQYAIGIDWRSMQPGDRGESMGPASMASEHWIGMASPRRRGPNPVGVDPTSIEYRNKMASPGGVEPPSPP